ncbi:hypothetical protein QBC38DRAFT_481062 [Podospora fimiseda]|uniref:Uncharacterized protein n=1 Tax=Podospora fimiseda TaxID=252190 RepID=A0AAN7H2C2_9PEZI|nr:hypothetical protein QBC38DRAFT_481062 [Podospora fimiseda]
MGLVNAPNKVPQLQRQYQAAYKNHTRIWKINTRSPYLLTPYWILLWGTTAAGFYGMGRHICGYKTWFGDK